MESFHPWILENNTQIELIKRLARKAWVQPSERLFQYWIDEYAERFRAVFEERLHIDEIEERLYMTEAVQTNYHQMVSRIMLGAK